MVDSISTRAARTGDAARIVELIRSGFDPDTLERFIYGCRGIERYVELLISDGPRGGDTRFIVAEDGYEIIGCIEMRLLGNKLFLNYVAVDARARKRGVASRLLGAAIRSFRRGQHVQLVLDVLDGNLAACAWYDSLGMTTDSLTRWYEMPIPRSTSAPDDITISGLAQARVCHARFGFSQLMLVGTRHTATVGMLGDRWFRTTSPEQLIDTATLACLHQLDPGRDMLALIPATIAVPSTCREVASTQRRVAPLESIAARLEPA